MKNFTLFAAIVFSATSAIAQEADRPINDDPLKGVVPTTQDFITQASASNILEIETSKLALQHGNDEVKTFAKQMLTDHEKASAEMKALTDSGKVSGTPAAVLTPEDEALVDELAKLQAEDFSAEYIDVQVDAHEEAVDLFMRYAKDGENEDMKAFAAKTLPTLEQHYKMIEAMDSK